MRKLLGKCIELLSENEESILGNQSQDLRRLSEE